MADSGHCDEGCIVVNLAGCIGATSFSESTRTLLGVVENRNTNLQAVEVSAICIAPSSSSITVRLEKASVKGPSISVRKLVRVEI
jgi:hypothetical protein